MARILGTSSAELQLAADALARGDLVAIPTETVYGLGGNALREDAVRKIYAVKGRPLTDPLICHTDTLEKARRMWDTTRTARGDNNDNDNNDNDGNGDDVQSIASTLGAALWPGPLTIVCRAHPDLPPCVTGGSGYVGARIPRHAATLELLRRVPFPVAAPSANTFGHVSPTTAAHVLDDLAARDPRLLVLDGGTCDVGIESTVVKVTSARLVEVLRRGRVCVSDLQAALAARHPGVRVEVRDTRARHGGAAVVADVARAMDAPGQLLTHYSPNIPASLLTPASLHALHPRHSKEHDGDKADDNDDATAMRGGDVYVRRGSDVYALRATVVIDFHGTLRSLADDCLCYRDLSPRGSAVEACHAVFDALRWSEQVREARAVVFPYLSEWPALCATARSDDEGDRADTGLLAAVEDRLFRAASGTTALLERAAS